MEATTTKTLVLHLLKTLDLTAEAVEVAEDTQIAEARIAALRAAIAEANTSLEDRPTKLALATPCTNELSDLLPIYCPLKGIYAFSKLGPISVSWGTNIKPECSFLAFEYY